MGRNSASTPRKMHALSLRREKHRLQWQAAQPQKEKTPPIMVVGSQEYYDQFTAYAVRRGAADYRFHYCPPTHEARFVEFLARPSPGLLIMEHEVAAAWSDWLVAFTEKPVYVVGQPASTWERPNTVIGPSRDLERVIRYVKTTTISD